ncbi:MAG: TIR domain-containing protein [Pseudomonadota bacterium]
MADIFISYARADRAKIEKLAAALEGEGYSVWWDRQIVGGSDFSEEIERELTQAKAVIVAWSAESIKSRWVKDEAGAAAEVDKLVPICLDDCGGAPLGFKQYHFVNFAGWNSKPDAPAFQELIRAVEARLTGQAPPAPIETPVERMRTLLIAGAIAAVAVAAGYWFLNRSTSPQPADPPARAELASSSLSAASRPLAAPVSAKSIAVLPFADRSERGDQAYFADGVAEEILNALIGVDGLQVAGRTSSFAYKGRNMDMREIGEALGVAHILEGSVRKQGERVRITARLSRASDSISLWSDSFDGTLDNVFDLQISIAEAIAKEMDLLLNVNDEARRMLTLTESTEAYDLFLQGRELVNRLWGADTLPNAVSLLARAVEIDPEFAEAWAMLSSANYLLPQYVSVADEGPYMAAAQEAAQRALTLDPDLATAHLALGNLSVVRHDYAEGRKSIDEALRLAPSDGRLVFSAAFNRMVIGQTTQAKELCARAMDLNPASGAVMLNCGIAALSAGDLGEAERLARFSVDLGFTGGAFTVAEILSMKGNSEAAIGYMEGRRDALVAFAEQFREPELWDLAMRAIHKREPQARSLLSGLIDAYRATPDARIDTAVVSTYHVTNRPETFMDIFEAHQFGNSGFVLSRIWDDRPESVAIRQHPEFNEFARRIGLVDAWNEYGWPDKCRPTGNDEFECD